MGSGWPKAGVGFFLVCLTGCAHPAPPPAPPPVQISPNLHVSLAVTPGPVRQMDPQTFTVRVTSAQGKPVSGAVVAVDLTMPGMDMGANNVGTRPQKAGTYVGVGRFTMDGSWQAQVTATKGADKTIQSFPIPVQ